ncbi:hypothetical protein HY494_01975 [Candidatus Woesearchaeota archaeon]|nr:hypothetical protein [Candidatus Woesearchaeota archaeon]
MQTVTLYLPQGVEIAELRNDLEEIITNYWGKKRDYFAFPLAYAVGLAQVYEFPSRGTVVTVTNDLNIFCDEALCVPGRVLWYNAKILLFGFNEETPEFQRLMQSFEYLNNKYRI